MRTTAVAVLFSAISTAAGADDNCQNIKETIIHEYPVAHWSDCSHATSKQADVEAALLCAPIIAEGANVIAVEHRVVSNWTTVFGQRISLPSTYLGFCAGVKLPGYRLSKSEREIRDEIQKALDRTITQR